MKLFTFSYIYTKYLTYLHLIDRFKYNKYTIEPYLSMGLAEVFNFWIRYSLFIGCTFAYVSGIKVIFYILYRSIIYS